MPLSELNLKKAAEEKSRRRFKNSDDENQKHNQINRKTGSFSSSRYNEEEVPTRSKGNTSFKNRSSSNSDDETFYNKKNFLKNKKNSNLNAETLFVSRSRIKNSDDSDKDFRKTNNSPKPRNLSRENTKSFSDDEISRARFQKPNSTYLRDSINKTNQKETDKEKEKSDKKKNEKSKDKVIFFNIFELS